MSSKAACRISFEAEDFGLEKFGNYKTSPYTFSGVSSIYCVRDFLRIPDGMISFESYFIKGTFLSEGTDFFCHISKETNVPVFENLNFCDF